MAVDDREDGIQTTSFATAVKSNSLGQAGLAAVAGVRKRQEREFLIEQERPGPRSLNLTFD
jgi:hypothetical protein